MSNPWLVPATALAASFAIACGSSPTSPSSSAFPVAAQEAAVAEASGAAPSGLPVRPTLCDVEGIMLAAKPFAQRGSWIVVATFKGDATECPAVDWSVVPSTRWSVDKSDPNAVVVFANPYGHKIDYVSVTATLLTWKGKVSQTIALPIRKN